MGPDYLVNVPAFCLQVHLVETTSDTAVQVSSPDDPVVSEEPLVPCYYVGEGAWPGHGLIMWWWQLFFFHVSSLMQCIRALGTFSGPLTYEHPLDLMHYFSAHQIFVPTSEHVTFLFWKT